MTGVAGLTVELVRKRLQLLHELVPTVAVVAFLVNPTNPAATESEARNLQDAARSLGLQMHILPASTASEIDTAFETLVELRAGALVVSTDQFFTNHRAQIVALAARHAVPAIYDYREYAAAGGLMSYGNDFADIYRQAGRSAGRAGSEGRAGHQSENRQGARTDGTAAAARPRGRGDRISR